MYVVINSNRNTGITPLVILYLHKEISIIIIIERTGLCKNNNNNSDMTVTCFCKKSQTAKG